MVARVPGCGRAGLIRVKGARACEVCVPMPGPWCRLSEGLMAALAAGPLTPHEDGPREGSSLSRLIPRKPALRGLHNLSHPWGWTLKFLFHVSNIAR